VARSSSRSSSISEPKPEGEEQETTEVERVVPTDNVGDISVEVNVEDLIAQLESESKGGPGAPGSSARRRIEDILDEKRVAREIQDLEDFDVEE
jgi:hypothetical protein